MSEEKKYKVIIPKFGDSTWTAGLTYMNNLSKAVDEFNPGLELNFIDIYSKEASNTYSKLARRFKEELFSKISGYDIYLNKKLKKFNEYKIDAVYNAGFKALKDKSIANIAWLPDFQHLHQPEMFSKAEIFYRNYYFRQALKGATIIVVSSSSALADLEKFDEKNYIKARIMSFVSDVPDDIYQYEPSVFLKDYNLPDKYIYLPNQFWKHKNHEVVIEALKLLREKNINIYIVCTGNTKDYRDSSYFLRLKEKINKYQLNNQIKILGLVPREHVYQLIRGSICVLNPSLFEGWSTTVEEAKSIGKRMLLSDIDVHKEQNPPETLYFEVLNPNDLAEKFKFVKNNFNPGPDLKLEEEASKNLTERKRNFAITFYNIIKEAVEMVGNNSS